MKKQTHTRIIVIEDSHNVEIEMGGKITFQISSLRKGVRTMLKYGLLPNRGGKERILPKPYCLNSGLLTF